MEMREQMSAEQNKTASADGRQKVPGLYDPGFEHDSCGIGAVVNMRGVKTHGTVEQALHIVENLEHRAGKEDRKSVV